MSLHASEAVIDLEYVADIACPWCYIGLERLKQAMRRRPSLEIRLRWRPFMLNPDLPAEGIGRADYLLAKFGPEAGRIYRRIEAIGRDDGIPFAFDRIQRQPNTTDAHRLVLLAHERGRAPAMIERLFQAFYLEGEDLTQHERLVAIAAEAGLDRGETRALFAGNQLNADVTRSHRTAGWQGIRGVPVYILGQAHVLSGAQPPEVITQLLDLARTPRAASA